MTSFCVSMISCSRACARCLFAGLRQMPGGLELAGHGVDGIGQQAQLREVLDVHG